ncbi:MAG: FHA domain-containing protein [Gemmatimonadetes bacterium]|nr:FHA domain-containing protein [Gemmatimonadota bacterium]
MSACAYCGRDNDPGAQFCMDCGKPLGKAAAMKAAAAATPVSTPAPGPGGAPAGNQGIPGTRVIEAPGASAAQPEAQAACPFCHQLVDGHLPFCPHCGRRLSAPGSGPACVRCASPVTPGTKFCATCGAPLGDTGPIGLTRSSTEREKRTDFAFTVVLIDETGQTVQRFDRKTVHTTIGRQDGDIRFPDDPFLSPLHAKLSWEENQLVVRDLGSRNGTWVFLEEPRRLVDGDLLLIGSQVIRFRRLGYPGPHAPDADATKRMGSMIPSADIASLTQLRSDGSPRDMIQLSPGRDIRIGRERGDWIFPYDPSMSGAHAIVRSEDADFVILDDSSRNGVAIAARGDMALGHGSRILVGDKLLRIELP